MKSDKLFDIRMNDGSHNFADLPESVFFDKLCEHAEAFKNAQVTEFITDWVTLDFEYHGHKFSINNQMNVGFLSKIQIARGRFCLKF